MNNPINFRTIAIYGPIFVGAPVIGFIWIFLDDGFDWFAVAIAIAIGFFAFLMVPGRIEFFDRPKAVEMTDSGVVLHQRFGRKTVFVPWSGISAINHRLVESDKRNWNTLDSYLRRSADDRRFTFSWQIAEAVRESYRDKVGYYPPNRMAGKRR